MRFMTLVAAVALLAPLAFAAENVREASAALRHAEGGYLPTAHGGVGIRTGSDFERFSVGIEGVSELATLKILLGDGHGEFRAQTVQQSGIRVLGDQRGAAAADYDGDARTDLAVSQNGAAMTLWHNATARPGLRVRLRGSAYNPLAFGAQMRIVSNSVRGPLRELHAGSGYWSMDAATTVLALPIGATGLWVRWPNGREQTVLLAADQNSISLTMPP